MLDLFQPRVVALPGTTRVHHIADPAQLRADQAEAAAAARAARSARLAHLSPEQRAARRVAQARAAKRRYRERLRQERG